MVRLEVSQFRVLQIPVHISIPLWFDWKQLMAGWGLPSLNYFNSTMVRLEVSGNWSSYLFYRHFNSTMVRLEGAEQFGIEFGLPDFNSTMVRLEVVCQRLNQCLRRIFQFHYGSIGRLKLLYFIKFLV